jgi:hypothetical protein
LFALSDSLWAEYAMLACVLLLALSILVAIGFMLKPTAALRPRWIIELEIVKPLQDTPHPNPAEKDGKRW